MRMERLAAEAHVAVRLANLEEVDILRRTMKERLRESFGIDHTELEFESAATSSHSRETIRQE
ncbi:hypothetical protein [Pseudaminobacter sp. NGMCC 1.201702]|uniref:hypothetical protein n=1 Tax=Pseudaminobacter sp. NGMCC 1.201702 TaxID=3391825 RepID=UPI0039F12B22